MQSSKEILSRNLNILLTLRGWGYSQLAEACEGEVSKPYLQGFKKGNVNPSLEILDSIAKALKVETYKLIDPNLDYRENTPIPQDYVKKTYILTKYQDVTVKQWHQTNEEMIKRKLKDEYDRLQKL